MRLMNERSQIRTVADRWRECYGNGTYSTDRRGRQVGEELENLDIEAASAASVAEIIGNVTQSDIVTPITHGCIMLWPSVAVVACGLLLTTFHHSTH